VQSASWQRYTRWRSCISPTAARDPEEGLAFTTVAQEPVSFLGTDSGRRRLALSRCNAKWRMFHALLRLGSIIDSGFTSARSFLARCSTQ